ncbi:hypothetical protein BDR04DRAFT_1228141 [Suillus decipiens]|nr:hypothetical protein BDR04DRAFT_1228141 [Suillus decipiens]
MTLVSNNPSWWPRIEFGLTCSYVAVASSTALVYDWVLMFGQELELVWKRQFSLVTVLYLAVRYGGILYSLVNMLAARREYSINLGDRFRSVIFDTEVCVAMFGNAMLGAIMIIRLHAMYQRSRTVLVFLLVLFLVLVIANIVIIAIQLYGHYVSEEFDLDGAHHIWETLAACLALRVAVKHVCEMRSAGQIIMIGNCLRVLIKTHVLYFACFATISCFTLGMMSPKILNSTSVGVQVYFGILEILLPLQISVLGPRLVLSVRGYHAKLMANSDTAIGMTTLSFQDPNNVSTGATSTSKSASKFNSPNPVNMTLVSNNPSWWPHIRSNWTTSYVSVASSTALVYDWALTFGQELELVWKHHFSLVTVLYLFVRYGGILYSFINILGSIPFAAVSCFILGSMSPEISKSTPVGVQVFFGILDILLPLQMFVLGPRLILSIRQYHAELVANSDAEISMTTLSFQYPINVSTGSGMIQSFQDTYNYSFIEMNLIHALLLMLMYIFLRPRVIF